MKVYLIIVSLFVYTQLLSQTGLYSLVYSYGVNDNNPIRFSINPYRNSAILKTGQHTLTASKFQTFRNRKYFGYNLNLHARLERFESDLRYVNYKISGDNETFNKLSLKFDWGLHWQFPILKEKLYVIPGFNFGITAYRNPVSRSLEMDNFNNTSGDFYYYIELQQTSHLQVHANASLNFVYQVNPQIGLRAFAKLHTTEKIQYYAFVLPASPVVASEYNEFDDNRNDVNLLTNSIHNLDIGIGLTFKLKNSEK